MPRIRPEERNRPITTPVSDPAVEAVRIPEEIMGHEIENQMARQRSRTPGQRRKAKKDQARTRMLIDLPEELLDLIDQLVEQEGVSKSRFVSFMTILGMEKLIKDGIDLDEFKLPAKSPRFEFALQLPEIPDIDQFTATSHNSSGQNMQQTY